MSWTLFLLKVYDYATSEPIENISWIWHTVELNSACSEQGLKGNYGLRIGKHCSMIETRA